MYKILRQTFALSLIFFIATSLRASYLPDQETGGILQDYFNGCQGSMMPIDLRNLYSSDFTTVLPDTLTPFFLNQVSRHGARFLSSESKVSRPRRVLLDAGRNGTITSQGEAFLQLLDSISRLTGQRWGELTELGRHEQELIAARFDSLYPQIFSKHTCDDRQERNVRAESSYIPRVVSSMYSFCHQLSLLHPKMNIDAESGVQFSDLMRFFSTDKTYAAYIKDGGWEVPYAQFYDTVAPTGPAARLIGDTYPADKLKDLSMQMYSVVQGEAAMGLHEDASRWFTPDEWKRCWTVANFSHALKRTETQISDIPTRSAIPLLLNIISSADSVIHGKLNLRAYLRFGHAETLMPLLALMRIPGCHIPSGTPLNEIPDIWHDWWIVPLGATFQLVYFRSSTGKIYVTGFLNGKSVPLLPDKAGKYLEWNEYKKYLLKLCD